MAQTLKIEAGGRAARVFDTPGDLADAVARAIVDVARECARLRGRFWWALSGGSTPRAVYECLARKPHIDDMPWDRTFVFFGDERAVPADHPDSNFRMASEAMLAHVPIPRENVFRVVDAHAGADRAAADYERAMRAAWGDAGIPAFDLILLGIGEDGHTASLFPGTEALGVEDRLVTVGMKDDSPRVTFTYSLLNHADRVWFLAVGKSKASVIAEVFSGGSDLPAAHVRPSRGESLWWLDQAAAANLK